ncbi:OmpA family protein [Nocardiopsis sediminis]|uniref:OmpA family protein n=1 Tax=Nocardiopsis sediminis TaxID=1778267 RepID=A0ABV8FL01_9ACTN
MLILSGSPTAWRPLRIAIPLIAASFLLTSCVSGGGDDAGDSDQQQDQDGPSGASGNDGPLATSLSTSTSYGSNLQLDINTLERESDDVVVLEMTATNVSENDSVTFDYALVAADGTYRTPDGVTLVDTANRERYFPLMNTDGSTCLCSGYENNSIIPAGESLDIWVAFPAPPDDVTSVAVATPATPDFMNIPLSDASNPDDNIANATVEDPRILPLSGFQDDIDGTTSREESGDETSILLSSDVLFELNESDLTPDADEALEQVAAEIDASSGEEIKIDGYTDNSGSDAINNPLSEERAESVRDRLAELVTREGVSFEVAGHGSSDPVADNGTDEGREKNRRVTVTFGK